MEKVNLILIYISLKVSMVAGTSVCIAYFLWIKFARLRHFAFSPWQTMTLSGFGFK
jgi:hypothetical protein